MCLGAMMFGAWGNTDHDESIRIIHRALDAGINFVDTADVYAQGESEEIVGKALAGGKRDGIVLASKVHGQMGDDPNHRGNSRRWIIQAVEDSLRRLQTDWIDLYQIHRPDPSTDIDETLGALTDLVRAGQDPLLRQLDLPRARDRRGAVGGRAARARTVRMRAAALLAPRPRDRGRGAAGLRALRDGSDHLEPARRRLAQRPLPRGRRAADLGPRGADPPALRHDAARQPGQARRRGAAREARRGARDQPRPPRARVRARASDRDERDHRAAHDGAARVAARRRRAPARCGDARPDRRDRAAGRHPQPGRRRLGAHPRSPIRRTGGARTQRRRRARSARARRARRGRGSAR